jgi:hypothetical protein
MLPPRGFTTRREAQPIASGGHTVRDERVTVKHACAPPIEAADFYLLKPHPEYGIIQDFLSVKWWLFIL